ncbi:MAG: peptidylprolyl isomerase [Spirulina sp. SIO3F2]|nr:peptidylprolyl isomerase [Spirulina sp. SIO3F2]
MQRVGLSMLFLLLFLIGCTRSTSDAPSTAISRQVPENLETITSQASNVALDTLPRLQGLATVVMTVNGQTITIEVDGEHAPITAGNFVDLVNKGVYDGLMFHRVIHKPEPFVAQGGDPVSADPNMKTEDLGAGSYQDPQTQRPRYIPLEIQPEGSDQPIYNRTLLTANIQAQPVLMHKRGAIAMARSQLPDSASAQFYFALSDLSFLDGDYAVFGYVVAGLEVMDNIQQGDRIDSAVVTEGIENLQQP